MQRQTVRTVHFFFFFFRFNHVSISALTIPTVERLPTPTFDNLYLDLNGVIHNCTHANDEALSVRFPSALVW